MLKANCSEEQKKMAEEQKKKAVYAENVITYDTRPIYETMSNVNPEAIQSAPQVDGTLSSTDVATTHKGMPIDTERQISQPELAQEVRCENLVQSECYEIPNSDTPITGETGKISQGETDCTGSPRPAGVTPAFSTNNVETPGGHTGGLGHTSTVDPPAHEITHVSNPNPDPDKVLEATIKDVVTKTLFRKEDVGPSQVYKRPL